MDVPPNYLGQRILYKGVKYDNTKGCCYSYTSHPTLNKNCDNAQNAQQHITLKMS